ncbi:winged helix DNA-binding domain-containing protein [Pseudonocardia sp. RS11V-5]|uniref:winged helix DNA-binding domain-containing protein n=1 Tax=Pseudonocardia terrae TaxID=2905831 RepID=UPI001E41BA2E|nr:winged helix DNA-binding domain-containing protein [Pseudonocardia terrae]MCE3555299.1 winged helix DNA-binding domain-containing protein [Pseudonocardia terrae]
MGERVLSWGELNRALLARQLLLERARTAPVRAVERVGGLQTQYAPSGYVGLWSRLRDFRPEDLTAALSRRRIVQAWVMRCTIHMVSAADLAPLTEAVREPRRRWWLRVQKQAAGLDMPAVAAAVRGYLAGGPRKQAEIVARLAEDGFPKIAFQGVQLWLDLVRVPPAGTWESPRAHVYGLAEDWVPASGADRARAEELLVERYLRGFGPASAQDVARYAGWTVTEVRAVLARLDTRRFRDPAGGELVDLPRWPLPAADTPAPVRFLSNWDAVLLLGHATRAGILPPEHREKVFAPRMPQSTPTFLVDGRVAGTWRFTGGRVVPAPFAELPAAVAREVAEEAERLTEFHLA